MYLTFNIVQRMRCTWTRGSVCFHRLVVSRYFARSVRVGLRKCRIPKDEGYTSYKQPQQKSVSNGSERTRINFCPVNSRSKNEHVLCPQIYRRRAENNIDQCPCGCFWEIRKQLHNECFLLQQVQCSTVCVECLPILHSTKI